MEEQNRELGYDRLSKYIRRLELRVSEHNATPVFADIERRVALFKEMTADDFLELLSVANGLLDTGKVQHWPGKSVNTQVDIWGSAVDFVSAKDAEIEFKKLFEKMKADIDASNIEQWSSKLYAGIIFSHMFANGNGRLGRSAYAFMKTGTLPEKDKLIRRDPKIQDMCIRLNVQAIADMVKKEGISESDDINVLLEFYANEKEDVGIGYFGTIKYITARRVLQRRDLFQEGQKVIFGDKWPPELMAEFEQEYERVKTEWFWETQQVVEDYDEWIREQLDASLA